MRKPDFIPTSDWNTVLSICGSYGVDPFLIGAIGWHETHWGKLGAGKIGWILGYGYFPGSTVAEKYKGLLNQVTGACGMISGHLLQPITEVNMISFAVNTWRSSAPESWARSVYSIYVSIKGNYTPPVTDTEIQDVGQRITELERKVTVDVDSGIQDLTKRVSFIEMVLKFIEEFFNNLKKEL